MREPAERLGRTLGHRFRDTGLVETALTHRSAGNINNERLEFLGDAILGFVIAEELFSHFVDSDEGELSRLRASLVKKDTLASIARDLDLGTYLNLGAGELRSGGQTRDSILADALEAIFAAIYLDSGFSEARQVILRLFRQRVAELTDRSLLKDPKTRLQELLQARKLPLPKYSISSISGEQHQQLFTVICQLSEPELSMEGRGGSRRKAEQEAAALMLEQLQSG